MAKAINLVVSVALFAAWAAWVFLPPDAPSWDYFASSPTHPPAKLFHARDGLSHNFKFKAKYADINTFARVETNAGAKNKGTAIIVCIHGFPETAKFSWDPVASKLENIQLDYAKVIFSAIDIIGFNESTAYEDAPIEAFSASAVSEDVNLLLEQLVDRFELAKDSVDVHVAGHDWGASVAWHIWQHNTIKELANKKLGNLSHKSTTIVNVPNMLSMQRVLRSTDQLWRSRYMFMFNLPYALIKHKYLGNEVAAWRLTYSIATKKGNLAEADLKELVALFPTRYNSMINWYRNAVRNLGKGCATCHSELPKTPVGVIWGLEDVALHPNNLCGSVKAAIEDFKAPASSVKIYPLEGVNHFVNVDRPDVVAAVIADAVNGKDELAAKYLNQNFCN